MGTLLESYWNQRDLRNFARTQEWTIAAQLRVVDRQAELIIARKACAERDLGRTAYLHDYIMGVLEAITSVYERETRKRLGFELYREVFVRYLKERFLLARAEAEALFRSASSRCDADKDVPGFSDGYADGLLNLRNAKCSSHLYEHFAQREAAGRAETEFATALAM